MALLKVLLADCKVPYHCSSVSSLQSLSEQRASVCVCVCAPAPQAALAAILPSDSLAFGAQVTAAEPTAAGAALTLASGQRLECLAVVGADGARSAVAAAAGRSPANYCGQSAIRGVARFPGGLPPQLQAGCIRQVWGPAARAGLYPVSGEAGWIAGSRVKAGHGLCGLLTLVAPPAH